MKRQTDAGHLRQLARGLYDYPKRPPKIGTLAPSPDALAKALAGRDEVRLLPSGAYAANLLGLSEQVPAKVVFLTDGPSRLVRIGAMTVQLRRTTPRNMAAAGRLSGLVIQALRHLGQEHATPERIAHLERTELAATLSKGQAGKWMKKAEAECVEAVRDRLGPELEGTVDDLFGSLGTTRIQPRSRSILYPPWRFAGTIFGIASLRGRVDSSAAGGRATI